MQVRVRFYAELARQFNGGKRQADLELSAGSSVADLLASIGVPDNLEHLIVGLNGQLSPRGARLSDGDQLELMTQMEGGQV